jgi:ATP-binding cassette subfamily B protein
VIINYKNIPSPQSILGKISTHLDTVRKKELKIILILSILASLAESISIAALIPFISFFINPESYLFNSFFKTIFESVNINTNKEILGLVSFLFISVVLISSYIKLKFLKLSNEVTENITSDFRIKIFNFLVSQDFNYYYKHGANEIMSNLFQKTISFSTVIFASITIINSIFITTAIVIILIYNEPFYTPILILSICLFFFVTFKIKARTVFQKGQKVNINQNFIIYIFENTVGYLPEIIIYNLKNFYSSIFTKTSEETAESGSVIRTISMAPRVYLEVFVIVMAVILIFFSGIAERSVETNVAYLAILAFGAQKCLPLVNNIFLLSVHFKGSTPTVLTFFNILGLYKQEIIVSKHYEALDFNSSIKLKNLSFQYAVDSPKVLNNINLEIKKGDKLAIKGETGSGKSTLINIISGLLTPTEGKILIDETAINKKNIKNWQKNISIVPQTIFLNDSTILENIAIAENLNKIDINRVKKCAMIAQIDEFIESLTNKYNEKVGERGIRLSGGQRQRIGIARALYRNSNLIIMDEPTNALDLETENLVMKSILNLTKDITIIMISHSDSTLKFFDKIIDLDKLK